MNELVLFLDDDHFEMLSLVDKLRADQYQVENFSDSSAALEWLKEGHKPKIIISDLIMRGAPPGDRRHEIGMHFCRDARRMLGDSTKIAVLSVIVDPAIKEQVLEYADDYLIKPVTPREIVSHIGGMLQ